MNMAKGLKIVALVVVALVLTGLMLAGIAVWWVFTPEKITPIINKQATRHLQCDTHIGRVELTFFSTFPDFGLKINDVRLITFPAVAPNDTLLDVGEAILRFDAIKLWKKSVLNIHEIQVSQGKLYLYTDSTGLANYQIWQPSESADENEESFALEWINAENIVLQQVDVRYEDHRMGIKMHLEGLQGKIHGNLKQNVLQSLIHVDGSGVTIHYQDEEYLSRTSSKLRLQSTYDFVQKHLDISDASLQLNDVSLVLKGEIDLASETIGTGLQYELPEVPASSLLELIPPAFTSYLEDLDFSGELYVKGSLEGEYSNERWPWIKTDLRLRNGRIQHTSLPFPLGEVNASLSLYTDFLNDTASFLNIEHASASHNNSNFKLEGTVRDIYSGALIDVKLSTGIDLDEMKALFPTDLHLTAAGKMDGNLQMTFRFSELEKNQWEKFRVKGNFYSKEISIANDSLTMRGMATDLRFQMPNPKPAVSQRNFMLMNMMSRDLEVHQWERPLLKLQNALLQLESSDLRDTINIPHLYLSYGLDSIGFSADTMSYQAKNAIGTITQSPCLEMPHLPSIMATYASDNISGHFGSAMAEMNQGNLSVKIRRDDRFKDPFKQWLFEGYIQAYEGLYQSPDFRYSFVFPVLSMDFSPERFNIKESQLKIGDSDFSLMGTFENVMSYFREDSILRGDFVFHSDTTDVFQLMNLTSGLGMEDPPEDADQGPYMVPLGIDVSMLTNIGHARMGPNFADRIGGILRVRDGTLVMEDMKLETPAAQMELTAMYRTPRKNHLFLGIDYRMLNVEIEELLEMIPDIDTLMPMLRSFRGTGEFHIAVETYLDSMYNIKKSTLRGASSITGQNLVLMDGETFSEIAKTLRFNKKTENIVDSLSTEFTIFREEIDIYPFLMVMDRYKAVIAGRHNFDLTFNYHVSVVESPLPFRLGVDIRGDLDNLSYRLARARYAEFYRPARRGVVENRQLELRRMIREALMGTNAE